MFVSGCSWFIRSSLLHSSSLDWEMLLSQAAYRFGELSLAVFLFVLASRQKKH